MNPLLWPRWAQALAGAAAMLAAFLLWLHFHDRGVVAEHERNVTAQVETRSTQAAAAASEAVQQSRSEVDQSNAAAREAAGRSDDPLKAGLNALNQSRKSPEPPRPAGATKSRD